MKFWTIFFSVVIAVSLIATYLISGEIFNRILLMFIFLGCVIAGAVAWHTSQTAEEQIKESVAQSKHTKS